MPAKSMWQRFREKIGLKNSTGSEVGIFGEVLVKGESLCTCS